MPAAAQRRRSRPHSDTLADECSCEVVQVQTSSGELVEEHRERKEAEPPDLSRGGHASLSQACPTPHVEEFALRYDDASAPMAPSPRNLVEKLGDRGVCTLTW